MITTISMPQELCEQVSKAAQSIGVSQRRFLISAIKEYLHTYQTKNLKKRMDSVYESYIPSDLDEKTKDLGVKSLRELTKNDTW